MDDKIKYRLLVAYLKLKITEAKINRCVSYETTKVGNEDDYLEYKRFCGKLEAFKEVLNEIEEFYI